MLQVVQFVWRKEKDLKKMLPFCSVRQFRQHVASRSANLQHTSTADYRDYRRWQDPKRALVTRRVYHVPEEWEDTFMPPASQCQEKILTIQVTYLSVYVITIVMSERLSSDLSAACIARPLWTKFLTGVCGDSCLTVILFCTYQLR